MQAKQRPFHPPLLYNFNISIILCPSSLYTVVQQARASQRCPRDSLAPFFFPPASPQTVGVNERRRRAEEEEETLLNVTLSPSNPARSTYVHRLVPRIREREKSF